MVAADIFREGRALYADHLAFTEHYPISEHARFFSFFLLYSSKSSSKLRDARYTHPRVLLCHSP